MSTLVLEIPEEVADALRLPSAEIEQELRKELALVLYQRGALSGGKARKLAGMTRRAFDDLLAERKVVRHYTEDDLKDDLRYVKGSE